MQPLTAENSLLLLVDLQDMFGMTISSIDQTNLVNNAAGIAKAAKVFNVPTILASANAKSFAGPVFQQVTQARSTCRCTIAPPSTSGRIGAWWT